MRRQDAESMLYERRSRKSGTVSSHAKVSADGSEAVSEGEDGE